MRRLLPVLALALAVAVAGAAAQDTPVQDTRRSGFEFMGPDTQAMQRDDGANPAMLSVLEGGALWNRAPGNGAPACAGCHGEASAGMAGVAARYPAFDEASGGPMTLEGRIRACRARHQKAEPFAYESPELLALAALVALQSRGQPITRSDPRLAPTVAAGEQLYTRRIGQLNLSCRQCHDDHAGQRLAAAPIPEGHATAYPIYRLEWQSIGSLQRRLRGCLTGVRAEAYAYGSAEMVALEAFLRERAAGMTFEAPGVRP